MKTTIYDLSYQPRILAILRLYLETMALNSEIPKTVHITEKNLKTLAHNAWNSSYTGEKLKHYTPRFIKRVMSEGFYVDLFIDTGFRQTTHVFFELFEPDE